MERLGRSKRICLIAGDDPGYLLIQPMDERDVAGFEHEAELIAARTHEPFALAGLVVEDWNRDLSPWEAPPVFGKEPFGNGAAATLAYIEGQLVPLALERCGLPSDAPVILGGYSLAGLFALWSGYRTDAFAAIAAVSPSVWFPGWIGFAESHDPLAQCIYLSLGDREEKAKTKIGASTPCSHGTAATTSPIPRSGSQRVSPGASARDCVPLKANICSIDGERCRVRGAALLG